MFALLDDDSSDNEEGHKSKAAPAPAAANKPSGNKKPRAPREDNRKPRDEAPQDGDRNQGKGGERRERSKGKGRKGGESRGDSGREYPRRSGTGRGRENSRSGGGKYNWGKEGDQQAPAEPKEGEQATQPEGAAAEAEPIIEEEPEEETMSLEEFEKQQAEKLASLNINTHQETREVEKDPDLVAFEHDSVEDQYACMFHDPTKERQKVSKKGRRGAKQADQVLNLRFDESNDGAGKGKGGKGDRRGKGDGKGRSGKGGNQSSKSNIDLSNDMAFPTLGA